MAKKISDELYDAYLQWHRVERKATDLHLAFTVLAEKHLGSNYDRLEQGRLIVELARMRFDKEGLGVSPSGKATVSETVYDEGSNPSTPKEEVEEEYQEEVPKVKKTRKRSIKNKEETNE